MVDHGLQPGQIVDGPTDPRASKQVGELRGRERHIGPIVDPVDRRWQRSGIGTELVRRTRVAVGEESMLLLLSAPEAMAFYPRIGMEAVTNGWIIGRTA